MGLYKSFMAECIVNLCNQSIFAKIADQKIKQSQTMMFSGNKNETLTQNVLRKFIGWFRYCVLGNTFNLT